MHFEKATLADHPIILAWLDKPHVQEFWDNSEAHREGIARYLHGQKDLFDYWIGYINNEPYSFLMTSDCSVPGSDAFGHVIRDHISKTGKTLSIDFMIGSEKHLNKGLGASTLEAFMNFIRANIEPTTTMFLIDPAVNNPRAKHVYEKAGFRTVAEFTRDFGTHTDLKHFLMVKTL